MFRKYNREISLHWAEPLVSERAVDARELRPVQPYALMQTRRVRQGVLRALAYVIGQDVGKGVTKEPLFLAVTQLHFDGQSHSQADEGQVEEWHPRFHTLSHAGAVDPLEFGSPEVAQLVLEYALPENGVG